MKYCLHIAVLLASLSLLVACHNPQREARRMVRRAETMANTAPDSTVRLIDNVLRMPVYFSERQRMDMALLQAEALFRDAPLDDDLFEDTAYRVATSPELERAAAYYAQKKQYTKAAYAALYSGYVQQHYNEKENAMRSYKAAEQYGMSCGDSLTVARAEYRIGKLLYYESRRQEALSFLNLSINHIGNRLADLATIENSMGVVHIFLKQFDSADMCFRQSLYYAGEANSVTARRKAFNNYAVLYRLQRDYEKAAYCLQQIKQESNLTTMEIFILNLNLGNVFFDKKEMDSAAFYYQLIESRLSQIPPQKEKQLATYDALYKFAERQNNDSLALQYREKHEEVLYAIMQQRQQQTVYRIQQQYDYESLQNTLNRKIIHRQRAITFLCVLAAIVTIVLAFSQIRLAKIKKQEAEIKASLLCFMEQNEKLSLQHEAFEKAHLELEQRHIENEEAYRDLSRQVEEYKKTWESYDKKLKKALLKEQNVMQKMAVYICSNKNKASFEALQYSIFGNQDYWEAMLKLFDSQYPNLRKRLIQKLPCLTEIEQKILVLSYLDTSREDTATLLSTSIFMVDKWRNSVRKKMLEAGF